MGVERKHRRIAAMAVFLSVPLAIVFNNCSPPKGQLTDSNSGASACPAPTNEALREPLTIDDTVKLINDLPKPLSLECFLLSLAKPLRVVAVDNPNSAQPSAGPDSPRLFILREPLILSVVPAGVGKNMLELSQIEAPGYSVKAEIAFPVTAELPPEAPYDHLVNTPGGTVCRTCHTGEYKVLSGYGGQAYASLLLRPDTLRRVSVANLHRVALNCDAGADGYRCGILAAVFLNGAGVQGSFPY